MCCRWGVQVPKHVYLMTMKVCSLQGKAALRAARRSDRKFPRRRGMAAAKSKCARQATFIFRPAKTNSSLSHWSPARGFTRLGQEPKPMAFEVFGSLILSKLNVPTFITVELFIVELKLAEPGTWKPFLKPLIAQPSRSSNVNMNTAPAHHKGLSFGPKKKHNQKRHAPNNHISVQRPPLVCSKECIVYSEGMTVLNHHPL